VVPVQPDGIASQMMRRTDLLFDGGSVPLSLTIWTLDESYGSIKGTPDRFSRLSTSKTEKQVDKRPSVLCYQQTPKVSIDGNEAKRSEVLKRMLKMKPKPLPLGGIKVKRYPIHGIDTQVNAEPLDRYKNALERDFAAPCVVIAD
jgi:hypothetical protein